MCTVKEGRGEKMVSPRGKDIRSMHPIKIAASLSEAHNNISPFFLSSLLGSFHLSFLGHISLNLIYISLLHTQTYHKFIKKRRPTLPFKSSHQSNMKSFTIFCLALSLSTHTIICLPMYVPPLRSVHSVPPQLTSAITAPMTQASPTSPPSDPPSTT